MRTEQLMQLIERLARRLPSPNLDDLVPGAVDVFTFELARQRRPARARVACEQIPKSGNLVSTHFEKPIKNFSRRAILYEILSKRLVPSFINCAHENVPEISFVKFY